MSAVIAIPGRRTRVLRPGIGVMQGIVVGYLSLLVLIPLAAVLVHATGSGFGGFLTAVTEPDAVAALELTAACSLIVAAINAVTGTLVAWVLVRDSFPGKAVVNSIIDLPFALPTIVAGLTLLELYGPDSPFHINLAFTRAGIVAALLFVTLPFVVRSVQPVLMEADRDVEEAAASLGASSWQTFRRIVLPAILPAILSGSGLSFARAMGEFGSVVLISGNIPYLTELASVHIYGQVESNDLVGAASLSIILLLASLVILTLVATFEHRLLRHGD